jgi:hypothetical protein
MPYLISIFPGFEAPALQAIPAETNTNSIFALSPENQWLFPVFFWVVTDADKRSLDDLPQPGSFARVIAA